MNKSEKDQGEDNVTSSQDAASEEELQGKNYDSEGMEPEFVKTRESIEEDTEEISSSVETKDKIEQHGLLHAVSTDACISTQIDSQEETTEIEEKNKETIDSDDGRNQKSVSPSTKEVCEEAGLKKAESKEGVELSENSDMKLNEKAITILTKDEDQEKEELNMSKKDQGEDEVTRSHDVAAVKDLQGKNYNGESKEPEFVKTRESIEKDTEEIRSSVETQEKIKEQGLMHAITTDACISTQTESQDESTENEEKNEEEAIASDDGRKEKSIIPPVKEVCEDTGPEKVESEEEVKLSDNSTVKLNEQAIATLSKDEDKEKEQEVNISEKGQGEDDVTGSQDAATEEVLQGKNCDGEHKEPDFETTESRVEDTEEIRPSVETKEKIKEQGLTHATTTDACISIQTESHDETTENEEKNEEEAIESDDGRKEKSIIPPVKEVCKDTGSGKVESEGVKLSDNSTVKLNEQAIATVSKDDDQEKEQEVIISEKGQGKDDVTDSQDAAPVEELQGKNYDIEHKEPDFGETTESMEEDTEEIRPSVEMEEKMEQQGLLHAITTHVCISTQTESQEETIEKEEKNEEEAIKSNDGRKEKSIILPVKEVCEDTGSGKAKFEEGVKLSDNSTVKLNEQAIAALSKDEPQAKEQEVNMSEKGQGEDDITSSQDAVSQEDFQEKRDHDEGNEPEFVETRESTEEGTEEIKSSVETKEKTEQQGLHHAVTTDVCISTQPEREEEETTENEEKNDEGAIVSDDGWTKKSESPSVKEVCEEISLEKTESKEGEELSEGSSMTLNEKEIASKDEDRENEQELNMSEKDEGGDDVTSSQNTPCEDIKETTGQLVTIVAYFDEQGLNGRPTGILKEKSEDKSIHVQEASEQFENKAKDKREQKPEESVNKTIHSSSEIEQEVEGNVKEDEADAGNKKEEVKISETEFVSEDFDVTYQVEETETGHTEHELKPKCYDKQDDRGSSEGTQPNESLDILVCSSNPKAPQDVRKDQILGKSEQIVIGTPEVTNCKEIKADDRMQSISSDLSSEKKGLVHVGACNTGPLDVNTIVELGEDFRLNENTNVQNPETSKYKAGEAGDETESETLVGTQKTSPENKDEATGEIPQSRTLDQIFEDSSAPLLKSHVHVITKVSESTEGTPRDVEMPYDKAGSPLAEETEDEKLNKKEDQYMDLESRMQKGNLNKDVGKEHFYVTHEQEKSIDASDAVLSRNITTIEAVHSSESGKLEARVEKELQEDTRGHKFEDSEYENPCTSTQVILEAVVEKTTTEPEMITEQDFQKSQSETNKEMEAKLEAKNQADRKEDGNEMKDDIILIEKMSSEFRHPKEQNVEETQVCLTKTISEKTTDEITSKDEDLSRNSLEHTNDNSTKEEKCFRDGRTREIEISTVEHELAEEQNGDLDEASKEKSTDLKETKAVVPQGDVMPSSSLGTSIEGVLNLGKSKAESEIQDLESVSDVQIPGVVPKSEGANMKEECLISATATYTDEENRTVTKEILSDEKTEWTTEIEQVMEHPSMVCLDALEEELGRSSEKKNNAGDGRLVEDFYQDSVVEEIVGLSSPQETKEENVKQTPMKTSGRKSSDTNREAKALTEEDLEPYGELKLAYESITEDHISETTQQPENSDITTENNATQLEHLGDEDSLYEKSGMEEDVTPENQLNSTKDNDEKVKDVILTEGVPLEMLKEKGRSDLKEQIVEEDNYSTEFQKTSASNQKDMANENIKKQIPYSDPIPVGNPEVTELGVDSQRRLEDLQATEEISCESKASSSIEALKTDMKEGSGQSITIIEEVKNACVDEAPKEERIPDLEDATALEPQVNLSNIESTDFPSESEELPIKALETVCNVQSPELTANSEDSKVKEECLVLATAEYPDEDNWDEEHETIANVISTAEELGRSSEHENITGVGRSVADPYQDTVADRITSESCPQDTKEENVKQAPTESDEAKWSDANTEAKALTKEKISYLDSAPVGNPEVTELREYSQKGQEDLNSSEDLNSELKAPSTTEESTTDRKEGIGQPVTIIRDVNKDCVDELKKERIPVLEDAITLEPQSKLPNIESLYPPSESEKLPIEALESGCNVQSHEMVPKSEDSLEKEERLVLATANYRDEHNLDEEHENIVNEISSEEELGKSGEHEKITNEGRSIEDPCQEPIADVTISEAGPQEIKEENVKQATSDEVKWSDTKTEPKALTKENLEPCGELKPISESMTEEQTKETTPQPEKSGVTSENNINYETLGSKLEHNNDMDSIDGERDIEEVVTLTPENQINSTQDSNAMVKDVILSEEITQVPIEIQKEKGTNDFKEQIAEKASGTTELQKTVTSDRNELVNEISYSDPLHIRNLEVMEVRADSQVGLEDLQVDEDLSCESRASSTIEASRMDMKEGIEQPVTITRGVKNDGVDESPTEERIPAEEDAATLEPQASIPDIEFTDSLSESEKLPTKALEFVSDGQCPRVVPMSEDSKVKEDRLVLATAEYRDEDNMDEEHETISNEISSEGKTEQKTDKKQVVEQPSIACLDAVSNEKKGEREDNTLLSEVLEEKVTELSCNKVKQLESKPNLPLETSSYVAETVNTQPETDIETETENDVGRGDIETDEGGTFFQALSVPMVTTEENSNIPESCEASTTEDQAERKTTEIEPFQEQVEVVIKEASANEHQPNTRDLMKESQIEVEGRGGSGASKDVAEAISAKKEGSIVHVLGLTKGSNKDGEATEICNKNDSMGDSSNTKTEAPYEEDLQGKNYNGERKEPGFVKTGESIDEDTKEIRPSVEIQEKVEQQGLLHAITTNACISTQTESQEETAINEEKNEEEAIESDDGRKEKSGSPSVKEVCEETGPDKAESEGAKLSDKSNMKLNEKVIATLSKDEDQEKEQELNMSEKDQGKDDVTCLQDAISVEDLQGRNYDGGSNKPEYVKPKESIEEDTKEISSSVEPKRKMEQQGLLHAITTDASISTQTEPQEETTENEQALESDDGQNEKFGSSSAKEVFEKTSSEKVEPEEGVKLSDSSHMKLKEKAITILSKYEDLEKEQEMNKSEKDQGEDNVTSSQDAASDEELQGKNYDSEGMEPEFVKTRESIEEDTEDQTNELVLDTDKTKVNNSSINNKDQDLDFKEEEFTKTVSEDQKSIKEGRQRYIKEVVETKSRNEVVEDVIVNEVVVEIDKAEESRSIKDNTNVEASCMQNQLTSATDEVRQTKGFNSSPNEILEPKGSVEATKDLELTAHNLSLEAETFRVIKGPNEGLSIILLSDKVEKADPIDIQEETMAKGNLHEEETEERTNIIEATVKLHHKETGDETNSEGTSTEAASPIEDVCSFLPSVTDGKADKAGYNKDSDNKAEEAYEAEKEILKEDVHLESTSDRSKITKEVSAMKQEPFNLPLARERNVELDAPVTHGAAATEGLEISHKYVTDDLIKVSEIQLEIQKHEDSAHTVDKPLQNKAHQNESMESKHLTGNIDASDKQGEPTAKSLNAEAEDLKATKASGTEPECSIKVFKEKKKMSDGKEKSDTAEPDKILFTDILHESTKGNSQVAENLVEEKEPAHKKDQKVEKEETNDSGVKTDEENEEEEDNQKMGSCSDTPVMVEASTDMEVKVHKKSHNILSGVGSKVKHSIAKVKKAITGKSSHPKPPSPKQRDEVIT